MDRFVGGGRVIVPVQVAALGGHRRLLGVHIFCFSGHPHLILCGRSYQFIPVTVEALLRTSFPRNLLDANYHSYKLPSDLQTFRKCFIYVWTSFPLVLVEFSFLS